MRYYFTKLSKLFIPGALVCFVLVATNGYSQTTVVPVTKDTTCSGDTVKLAASSLKGITATFSWADTTGTASLTPNTGDTISVFPAQTTHYRVIGDTNGVKDTTYFTVTVNPLPNVIAASTKDTVCAKDSIILTGSGAKTYVWDNGAVDSVKMPILNSTTFNVTGTDSNGCVGKDSASVFVKMPTMISTFTNDSVLCKGDSTMLWASGASTHTWTSTSGMTPVVADTIKVGPAGSTMYYVGGAAINGCLGIDSIKINLSPDPVVKMILSDTTPCFRDTVKLIGTGAKTYSWSYSNPNMPNFVTGDTTYNVADKARKYWVVGIDSNGCVGSDTMSTTKIKAWPSEGAKGFVEGLSIGTSTEICNDQMFTLKANQGNNTYKWSANAALSDSVGSSTSLLVTKATTISLKVDSSNGCSAIWQNTYTPNGVKPPLTLRFETDSVICINDTAKASIAGGDSYLWSPGSSMSDSNSTNVSLFPTVSTPYMVKGISRGCVTTVNFNVTVNPLPDISLAQSSNGKVLCTDVADTITITSNSGVLFDWGFGVVSVNKIKALLPGKTSTVTIKAISAKGCVNPAQVTINVDTTCGVRVGIDNAVSSSDIKTFIVDGGELHLHFGSVPSGQVQVDLINMTGAVAKSFNLGEIISNNEKILNVSDLPRGIYLLRVKSEKYEIVNKIMH